MPDIVDRLNRKSKVVGDCKIWTGKLDDSGHGVIKYEGKSIGVHRLAAHLFLNFNLDSQLQVNHKLECTNPACWEHKHLYIGTQEDNMLDRRKNTTHCIHGHERNDTNTYKLWMKDTQSYSYRCKVCQREQRRKHG